MSMRDNNDGTVTCTKCNDTYLKNKPNDIFDKIAKGKRCDVCLGLIWNWINFSKP